MSKSNVCILCMIGLPGAGKTYLASQITANKIGFTTAELVSFDDYFSFSNSNLQLLWKEKRRAVFRHVETIIVNFLKNKKNDHSLLIVLDDNMYYRSMRYDSYKLARQMSAKYCQIFMDTPLDVCCTRNQLRQSVLPDNHIISMNMKLERPSDKYTWEKYTLRVAVNLRLSDCFLALQNLIFQIQETQNVGPNCPSGVKKEHQSSKHIADIALRKIVSHFVKAIKHSSSCPSSSKIEAVIEKRHMILDSINDGHLSLPELESVDAYVTFFTPHFTELLGGNEQDKIL